jgi:hypothetical protein
MLDIEEVLERIKDMPDAERLAVLKDLEILQEKTADCQKRNCTFCPS